MLTWSDMVAGVVAHGARVAVGVAAVAVCKLDTEGVTMKSKSMSVRPWGLTRAAPFGSSPGVWPVGMSVDPITQTGVYVGPDGEVMPIMASAKGQHGSLDQTSSSKTTFGKADGQGPPRESTDTEVKQDND